jgi:hypothetical protein
MRLSNLGFVRSNLSFALSNLGFVRSNLLTIVVIEVDRWGPLWT